MSKVCTKCNVEKEYSDFYKDKRRKDGLRSWCKACQKKDNRRRESKYKDTRRKYREDHQDEYRAKKREYYHKNKEKLLDSNRTWRQTQNGKWLSYLRSADKRKIPFELTKEEFLGFWNKPCTYCGEPIETVGIDRVDPDKSYCLDNTVSCCSTCNTMKMSLTQGEFLSKIKQVIKHFEGEF